MMTALTRRASNPTSVVALDARRRRLLRLRQQPALGAAEERPPPFAHGRRDGVATPVPRHIRRDATMGGNTCEFAARGAGVD
ncbi:unnamed protein product [Plutella xylostella]|uniref:(diamondback moth) hypothetical protein n=1 Tax=Plutella xylostella TaxID=51655 RepID=A0A8S4CYG2_PLUXY|nr:unnamed protein product [Plutella xylostella]